MISTVPQVHHLIGGEAVPGRHTFEVKDPGRPADVVAVVAEGDAEHVDRAVVAAGAASGVWAGMALGDRLKLLTDGLAAVESIADELAATLVHENGALLREAQMDVNRAVALSRSMFAIAEDHLADHVLDGPADVITVLKQPVGIVGMVVPWNSPMVLAASKVAPALAAGNTVILKPSPEAPVALTRAMATLAAFLPPGVLNVVNSAGGAGPTLSAHPDVRKMSFTGSTQVGRAVMSAAAGNLKRVSLELGGNDAAVILDDVDLEASVDALASGVFTRAGQICFAIKRIYVARSRHDELVDALCARVDRYVVGHGMSEGVDFGPLINARQAERVIDLVDRALVGGAKVHELGRLSDEAAESGGHYLRPVVVTGVDQSAELVSTEQFGPAIPVIPFGNVDEAVTLANDSEFGLASSVWSSDPEKAFAVAARLQAGSTFVNSHNVWSLSFDMPFGGVKQSGIGRERTALGFDEYIEHHAIRVPKHTT
ncbi:aldehyde dehydrogenase family protein [Nocardioides pyridinolyticus]